jgi:NADH dehydrogenase FAD-containing subunit
MINNPIDTGASKLIADGKIKLKTDSVIKSFSENSIVFENGTELAADVVVFATG